MSDKRWIISVGDLVADLITSVPSLPVEATQHQEIDDIFLEPGGAANFLIAGARLGYPMAAIGVLGDDAWGHQVAQIVQAEGANLSGVQHEGTTTIVIVLVSRAGEHVFLGKYGHGGTINLREDDIALIKKGGALYCAGYTLNEPRLLKMTIQAMRLAKQKGIPIFFDPGPHIGHISESVRQTVLSLADILLLTEDELSLLTPGKVTDLLSQGPWLIVVKRGAAGCVIYYQQETWVMPGYSVSVVDTTAAGDSFDAAFIGAYLRGWSLRDCAKLANAVGAAAVKKLGGGRHVPTLAEIQAVIDAFEIDINVRD